MVDVGFNFPRAQRDAGVLNEFVEKKLHAITLEGSNTQRYMDAISVMDPIDSLAFLWLLLACPHLLPNLPPLE